MGRSKRKNGCASGALIVLLIALIAIFVILAKNSFMGNEQSEPPLDTSISSPVLTQSPAQTDKPNNSAETENVLILVNKDNELPDDYSPDLAVIESVKVAKILLDNLNEMRSAAEKENFHIYIRDGYRTRDEQEKTFNDAVAGYVNQGNSQNVAVERAEQVAARPGHSEHQTGLAIDFSYSANADKQAEMWDWLSKNAYKYGFILRYPEGKEHITGYNYEPWHYRYVGKEHAKAIYEQGVVFEEYLNTLR